MKNISAIAIFCEDIRREGPGRVTLIGIYPDSMDVPSFPGALRRLSVYFRLRLKIGGTFDQPISVDLEAENAVIDHLTPDPVPQSVVQGALKKARDRGMPYASLTARMEVSEPVPFASPTLLKATLKVGDKKEVCGLLNVRAKESSEIPPNVSPQPSSQSPSGA